MNVKVPLITLVVVLLVGLGTYFFFLGPEFQKQSDLRKEQENLLAQETQLQTQISLLKDLQANQVTTRAKLNRISSFLPDGPDQPGFLASMQGVADSASVQVTDMSFGAPTDVKEQEPFNGIQLSQMTVSTTVKGDYFRLIDFLRRVEFQLGRAMVTSSVNLNPQDERDGGGGMTMNMESTAYFYRPAGSDDSNPLPSPSASPSGSAAPSDGASAPSSDASGSPLAPQAPTVPDAQTGGQ